MRGSQNGIITSRGGGCVSGLLPRGKNGVVYSISASSVRLILSLSFIWIMLRSYSVCCAAIKANVDVSVRVCVY